MQCIPIEICDGFPTTSRNYSENERAMKILSTEGARLRNNEHSSGTKIVLKRNLIKTDNNTNFTAAKILESDPDMREFSTIHKNFVNLNSTILEKLRDQSSTKKKEKINLEMGEHLAMAKRIKSNSNCSTEIKPNLILSTNDQCIDSNNSDSIRRNWKIKNEIGISTIASKLSEKASFSEARHVYACAKCARTFARRDALNIHYTHTHRERPRYACDMCELVFMVKRELSTHVRIHNGEQPQRCKQCGMEFGTRQLLNKHNMVHSGVRSHYCPICPQAFFQKGHLTQHMQIHAGVRPHKCPLCVKTFIFKFDLNRHMKIHAERGGNACLQCGKGFSKSGSLEEHISKCKKKVENCHPSNDELSKNDSIFSAKRIRVDYGDKNLQKNSTMEEPRLQDPKPTSISPLDVLNNVSINQTNLLTASSKAEKSIILNGENGRNVCDESLREQNSEARLLAASLILAAYNRINQPTLNSETLKTSQSISFISYSTMLANIFLQQQQSYQPHQQEEKLQFPVISPDLATSLLLKIATKRFKTNIISLEDEKQSSFSFPIKSISEICCSTCGDKFVDETTYLFHWRLCHLEKQQNELNPLTYEQITKMQKGGNFGEEQKMETKNLNIKCDFSPSQIHLIRANTVQNYPSCTQVEDCNMDSAMASSSSCTSKFTLWN